MRTYTPLSHVLPMEAWPAELLGTPDLSFLDELGCVAFEERGGDGTFGVWMGVQCFAEELRLALPFLEGVALVLGGGDDAGVVEVEVAGELVPDGEPNFVLSIRTAALALAIDTPLLRPVELVPEGDTLRVVPREGGIRVPLPFGVRLLRQAGTWGLEVETPLDGAAPSLSLPTCAVGNTGVVIEASNLSLSLSGTGPRPAGTALGWKGVYLEQGAVYLPGLFAGAISATGFGIGTGGVSGAVTATFPDTRLDDPAAPTTYLGSGAASLGGFHFGIRSVRLELRETVPVGSAIQGGVLMPFFDQAVECSLSLGADGRFSASFAGTGPEGLFSVRREDLLAVSVRQAAFSAGGGGPAVFELSGQAELLVPGMKAPPLALQGLRIASDGGVNLAGGDIALPTDTSLRFMGLDLGISSLGLGAAPGSDDRFIRFAGTVNAPGGAPITVSAKGVEIRWSRAFLGDPLGHPPRVSLQGVGVAVEAGPVRGGGMLVHDAARSQYAGALELEFQGIGLGALGLLTTRTEAGEPIFSLLVVISAELPAVQLGFGFTLNAVGGVLGAHRSVNVDVLREGLRGGSLDAILFPPDPVANAPRLLDTLSRVFPVTRGRFVVGPMARLGWGTPTLVTLDLALALEVPDPVRLMVLGRMKMALPDPKKPVVLLQMDVLGVIDFARGDLAIDATLRGSRIASFPISGDMAVRASWGRQPLLIAAAGGFNPRFTPPPGFPKLERLAIQLATGNNPRVRLEAYLALTSNTLQFGARLDVYFARDLGSLVGKFSVEAALGFDALVQFDPFGFVVDIHAHAALRRNGEVLLGLTLDFMLAGPGAWHVKGTATFHFLGKHTIGFEKRFGGAAPPRLPKVKANDVRDRVVAALADGGSWSAELPAGSGMLVTLRPAATADGVLVHPLGRVTARQRVAPLGVTLQRHGAAELDAPRALRVQVTSDGARVSPVRDFFAPADHFSLSDDQKLSRPSFEELVSGVQVGSDTAEHGPARVAELAGPLAYDTTVMDPDFETWKAGAYAPTAERLAQAAAAGAVARAHDAGASRFGGPALDLRVRDAAHAVVAADTLAPVADPDAEDEDVDLALSFTEALEQRAYLADKLGRRLMVVGAHEVGA